MKEYTNISGVPSFKGLHLKNVNLPYCVLIPVINEGERIQNELKRAYHANIPDIADIIICDGGSTDGGVEKDFISKYNIHSILVKTGPGKQGAQLRMGIWWALKNGYKGIITIDGNDKDSIEDVPKFIQKLEEGYDFIQGSRFVPGGKAINTPVIRYISVRLLHAPIISITAHHWFTDTTNAYRGYSRRYLEDSRVQPLRDIFMTYELLAYLSVRASQLGMKVCEIPVTRIYPIKQKTPTKISPIKGNYLLLKILFKNLLGKYAPEG